MTGLDDGRARAQSVRVQVLLVLCAVVATACLVVLAACAVLREHDRGIARREQDALRERVARERSGALARAKVRFRLDAPPET